MVVTGRRVRVAASRARRSGSRPPPPNLDPYTALGVSGATPPATATTSPPPPPQHPPVEKFAPRWDREAVRLELSLAGASHADAAAQLREECPHSRPPRQLGLDLGVLPLHVRFGGPRPNREDAEDQHGAS